METNACDVDHLDADSLLPPRKRLLAGLKRQNSDLNSPAPSTSNNAVSEYDIHLNNLLKACLRNPNLSNEEIVENSKLAAIEAAKVAEAARAIAEEKAALAAKAVAAAKNALDLVATLSEEAAGREKYPKKNKMKKQVNVQALYTKNKVSTNCGMDEELARSLHRVINSSPRILKNTGSDDTKGHKHKRLKGSVPPVKSSNYNCGVEFGQPLMTASNANGQVGDLDTESSIKEVDMIIVDLNTSKFDRGHQLMLANGEGPPHPSKIDPLGLENGEADAVISKDRLAESPDSLGKKKGKIKQKKLPLSICSFRDKTSPTDNQKSRGTLNAEDKLLSIGPSGNSLMPVEKMTLWKCQSFKTPACIKQNKVVQS